MFAALMQSYPHQGLSWSSVDDGEVVHNIECTNNSQGGFQSHPDEHYQESRGVPDVAIECGSDLRALSPRQMLGLFIGLRGRHCEDTGLLAEAETDYLLARTLFPENRRLYMAQIGVSVQLSARAVQGSALVVGTTVVVSAVTSGYILSVAGQALAFIPNEIGASLLHHERITPRVSPR